VKFTICALLFGDYPHLAQRCLESLGGFPADCAVRIYGNAISPATQECVVRLRQPRWRVQLFSENRHKYPVMREALYGAEAVTTPYLIWLDDDSYFQFPPRLRPAAWLAQVDQALVDHVLLGSPYVIPPSGRQRQWIEHQPWYRNVPVRPRISFCTGGGWAARVKALRQLDYPWPALDHRGGDVMLGEAFRQQGWRCGNIHRLTESRVLFINANEQGVESASPRRGYDSRPIGYDFGAAGETARAGAKPKMDLDT
jgi:hypothetical protein